MSRRSAFQHDDVLDHGRAGDGIVDDLLQRHVLAFAIGDVRREDGARAREADALSQRARPEAGEDDDDHHADADRAEHQHDRLGAGRHVDRDPVALLDPEPAQRRADTPRLLVQLRVGVGTSLAALVLGDQRRTRARARLHVVVDAVVGEVRQAAAIPAERRRLPLEHALPLAEPGQRLCRASPEALGILGRLALPRRDLALQRAHVVLPN